MRDAQKNQKCQKHHKFHNKDPLVRTGKRAAAIYRGQREVSRRETVTPYASNSLSSRHNLCGRSFGP